MVNFAPMSGADNTLNDENGDKIGHRVRAKIGKNKVGSPYKNAEYFIEYVKGIANKSEEVLTVGEKIGLIKRPSSRSYEIFEDKYTSRKDALNYISENLEKVEGSIRQLMTSDSFEEEIIEIEDNPFG